MPVMIPKVRHRLPQVLRQTHAEEAGGHEEDSRPGSPDGCRGRPPSCRTAPPPMPPSQHCEHVGETVAVVRDQPNAASMGVRNRLNAFMLMDVMVTTAADMMTIAMRGSRISVSGPRISAQGSRRHAVPGPGPGHTPVGHARYPRSR